MHNINRTKRNYLKTLKKIKAKIKFRWKDIVIHVMNSWWMRFKNHVWKHYCSNSTNIKSELNLFYFFCFILQSDPVIGNSDIGNSGYRLLKALNNPNEIFNVNFLHTGNSVIDNTLILKDNNFINHYIINSSPQCNSFI